MTTINYTERATGYVAAKTQLASTYLDLEEVKDLITTALSSSDDQALGVISALAEHDITLAVAAKWKGDCFKLTAAGFEKMLNNNASEQRFIEMVHASKMGMTQINWVMIEGTRVLDMSAKKAFAKAISEIDSFSSNFRTLLIDGLSEGHNYGLNMAGSGQASSAKFDPKTFDAAVEAIIIKKQVDHTNSNRVIPAGQKHGI